MKYSLIVLLASLSLLAPSCSKQSAKSASTATPSPSASAKHTPSPSASATAGQVKDLVKGTGKPVADAGGLEVKLSLWTDHFGGKRLIGMSKPINLVTPVKDSPLPGLLKLVKGMRAGGKRRATIEAQSLFDRTMLLQRRLQPHQVLFAEVSVDKVFAPQKLVVKTVKKGTGSETVRKGSKIRIHYTGWTGGFDKKKFGSSHDRGLPVAVQVGTGNALPGWERGIIGMRKGGVRRLVVPLYMEYGVRSGHKNPPGDRLYFQVKLVDFIAPGKLKSVTVKPGKGAPAKDGEKVRVNYTGWLDGFNGKHKFSSSLNPGSKPFEFVLGKGQVIPGWDQGVKGMKPGEERHLTVPYNLAYGARGRPGIPPYSTLYFDVQYLGPAKAAKPAAKAGAAKSKAK